MSGRVNFAALSRTVRSGTAANHSWLGRQSCDVVLRPIAGRSWIAADFVALRCVAGGVDPSSAQSVRPFLDGVRDLLQADSRRHGPAAECRSTIRFLCNSLTGLRGRLYASSIKTTRLQWV